MSDPRSTPRSSSARSPSLGGLVLVAALAVACGKVADDTGAPPPEVAGNYQVFPTGTVGCEEGDSVLITDWAEGPLLIEGPAGSLRFDFGEDYAFDGYVGGDARFRFSGEATSLASHLDIDGSGTFENVGGYWKIDGQFDAVVDEDGLSSNDCTLTVTFEATELHAEP